MCFDISDDKQNQFLMHAFWRGLEKQPRSLAAVYALFQEFYQLEKFYQLEEF